MALDLPADWSQCTVPALFAYAVARRGDAVALMYKDYGIWQSVTWREYGERAAAVAAGLFDLGLAAGDRVAILAETRHEWLYADLGTQGAGGVALGLYPTASTEQVGYILNDSAAVIAIVEDDQQLDKLLDLPSLPQVRHIVVMDMDGLAGLDDARVLSLDALMERGRARLAAEPGLTARLSGIARPGDDAILVYTSGTTGPPKGARLTHRNLAFQLWAWQDVAPTKASDETLAFLPLCHVAERLMTALRPLAYPGVVNFAESPDAVLENLREVQPTVFLAVPRIWEKLYSLATLAQNDATPLQRLVHDWAMRIGTALAERRLAGRPLPLALALARRIAGWVVLDNVRRMLGLSRCRLAGSGAAPIAPEVIRWYGALDLSMIELYGQTECGGIATVTRGAAPGSVGRAVRGVELRIADDGEILIRSPGVFPGYRNQPGKSAEALADGWLHTGDVGRMDDEGNLSITDRKSDIMITSGGKNITPSEIENKLKFSPYITDAVVIGDARKFLTCLIMIDHDNVAEYVADRRVAYTDYASLTRLPEVRELIDAEVTRVNDGLSAVEGIKKFALIDVLLTAEDEEMTPTLKLRRKFVSQKYADMIEAMYRGD